MIRLNWRKIGLIFELAQSPLPERGLISHAQSPQALVYDDFVRIYFSSRRVDNVGKYISCPQYVDFDKSLSSILRYAPQDVMPQGGLGCFDEHGIFPFSPLRDGGQIKAYTSGWTRRVSVDVDSGIGLAVSNDNGETFSRVGSGPVLTASLQEPFLVIDAFVRRFAGCWHMFYIAGKAWRTSESSGVPERVYKIRHAVSYDGINWERTGKQIIPDAINENECQALPCVMRIGKRYCMIFCYRAMNDFRTNRKNAYRLGFASSDNLTDWNRNDKNLGLTPSLSGWDAAMQCYPHLFTVGEKIYLLYNGNDFGRNGFGMALLEDCDGA